MYAFFTLYIYSNLQGIHTMLFNYKSISPMAFKLGYVVTSDGISDLSVFCAWKTIAPN